jgi:Mg-chelatase subunit ChlI
MRVIELPINASEDRVVGTIDLEAALREGVKRFEPGVLAEANRNVLYVDEVNLLDDHIVDVLLDAAATGVNVVEREGVSISHPARFILVGTMNPEEGDLRPQLLDRFGLCVDVGSIHNVEQRVEIVQQRARWEDDPVAFAEQYAASDDEIRQCIAVAVDVLPKVEVPRPVLSVVARLSISVGVEGHRADLVCGRAAAALAAYTGDEEASVHHIMQVAEMVYAHRRGLSEAETGSIATLLNRIMSGEGRRAAGYQPAQDITPGKHVSRLPGDESFEDEAAEESCCG